MTPAGSGTRIWSTGTPPTLRLSASSGMLQAEKAMRTRISIPIGVALLAACLVCPTRAVAQSTVDFEQFPPGTVIADQYADQGGVGQGVVFGPLPGGNPGEGLKPVIRTPPAGEAQSGSQVADIATCLSCEFFTPRTTGTLATPRSTISLYVGYLGDPAICTQFNLESVGCAIVKLRAFDANGTELTQASVRVTRGAGVHGLLSVSTPQASIVGFEISARPAIDDSKPIAIDDLRVETPPPGPSETPTPPPTPDFTLNPQITDLIIEQGKTATVPITIGRLNGSSGDVDLAAGGLPDGVTPSFSPDPAGGTGTMLTLTASTAAVGSATATVTGTPLSPSAGPGPRSFGLRVTVQSACPQAHNAEELVLDLALGFKCIFIVGAIDLSQDLSHIDVPDGLTDPRTESFAVLTIPEGVTLMGGRSPTFFGGFLTMTQRPANRDKQAMLLLGSDTHVTGLHLRAYNHTDTKDRDDPVRGIAIFGAERVRIDNNEIYGWPMSGVYVRDTPNPFTAPQIRDNFIHNNVQCNDGQGVQMAINGFAIVEHNVFSYNRHDIGAQGNTKGYIAAHNFNLTRAPTCYPDDLKPDHYNQHYDIHGTHGGYGGRAGDFVDIFDNTIRGAQSFLQVQRRPAFMLRGVPDTKAIFRGNAVHHAKARDQSHGISKGAVQVKGLSVQDGLALARDNKLVVRDTKTCVDTADELAAGDFNGDGRDDVFQAVGTLWVYSPSGSREWFVLRDSGLRLAKLGLGDFNGDRRTDVFTQTGSGWSVSDGGTAPFTPLPVGSPIPIGKYRFGDFDGDGRTDVFRADGKRFFISSAATTDWLPLAPLKQGIGDLRFGDFDGDGKTDVFSLAKDQWSVSFGATTDWRRLNRKLASKLGQLAFADFNGDGKTDVARTSGSKWEVSLGGVMPWRTLAFGRPEPLGVGMLFGDFTGDGRDDVLQHGEMKAPVGFPPCWAQLSPAGVFDSFNRFKLSPSGSGPLKGWSVADIR
jgi:hypothetical protein